MRDDTLLGTIHPLPGTVHPLPGTIHPLPGTVQRIVAVPSLRPLVMMVVAMPTALAGRGRMRDGTADRARWRLRPWLVALAALVDVGHFLWAVLPGDGGRVDPPLAEPLLADARGDGTDEPFEERLQRLRREEPP